MPDNILGKVGEKVGAEIKTTNTAVAQVAADLAALNINSITGDLSVTGDVGAATATITGKITAGSLEVGGETKIVDTVTVEISDNIIELNKADDGTVTATTSGISVNRGFVAEVVATDDSFTISGNSGQPTYAVGTEGAQYSVGMASTSSAFALVGPGSSGSTDLTAFLGTIESSTSATTPQAYPVDSKYFVRQYSNQTFANEAFEVIEVWMFTSNDQWVSTLLIQAYLCDGSYNITGTDGDWYEHADAGNTGLMYSATGLTRNAGSINMTWTQSSGGSGTAGSLAISNAADSSSGTAPNWLIWDDGTGNAAEEVGYLFTDYSNGNITAPFIEYTSWSDVTTFISAVTPSDSSLASLSPPSELPWVTNGNGTVTDDTYYMRSHTYTTPGGSGVNTFEIWWRDANSTDDYAWKVTLMKDDESTDVHEFDPGGMAGTALLEYQYTSNNFSGTLWFLWVDGPGSSTDYYPYSIAFTAPTSGGGTTGTWSGTLAHAEGLVGSPESTNDKAEFLWNNTDTTFETNLGSVLTRVKTDGIDVPDGDGVKINTVALGTYALFESEFNTALA